MSADYQKMYATLVGRVDKALTQLEESMKEDSCDRFQIQSAAEILKTALLETEEMFVG